VTRLVFGALARRALPAALRVAVQNVGQAPLMAQVAASGLIVSFALTVSMVTMVSSFRIALDQWLDEVLPAPYYMRSKGVPLPAELLAALERPDAPFARVERMAVGALSLDPQRPAVAVLVRELDRADPGARLPFSRPVFTARRRQAFRSGSASRCSNCIACNPASPAPAAARARGRGFRRRRLARLFAPVRRRGDHRRRLPGAGRPRRGHRPRALAPT
jgi:hypothetical protein